MKMQKMLLAGLVSLCVSAWAAWNDDLPETFDASSGYVVQQASDSFSTPAPCETDFVLARHWADGQAPHAGAKYYSNRPLYTPFYVTNSSIAFGGDALVVGNYFHLLTGNANNTSTLSITIDDLVFLGGMQLASYGPKHALAGNLRIRRSSSSKPVNFYFMTSQTFRYPIHSTLDGDADQVIACTNTGTGVVTYSFDGNLANYKGLFRASRVGQLALKNPEGGLSARVHIGPKSKLTAADYGDLSLPELRAETGADLTVTYGKTFTVGDFILADGVNLNFTYDKTSHASGRFVVTNSIALAGTVNINIPSYEEADDGYEVEILRFAPTVDSSQVSLTKFVFLQADNMIHTWMELRENADGGKSLILKSYPLIRHTSDQLSNNSKISDFHTITNSAGKALWSNGSAPLLDEDVTNTVYYSNYTTVFPMQSSTSTAVIDLPMKSLYLGPNGSLWSFNWLYGIRVNLTMKGSYIQMANSGVQDSAFKALDGTTTLNTFRLQGVLNLGSGTTSKFYPYGGTMLLRAESEIRGGGDLTLSTYKNAGNYRSNAGYHELAGTNVNWTGLIKVSSEYERTKYAASGVVTPNDSVCVRLFVSDSRNLGGARSTFAYNALHLEHHAVLVARNSLTLEDGLNRGVSIGDRGRILVPTNVTLTIARPLTLNGNLVKEGPGALVLGGTLGFLADSSVTETPVAGSNLVTVSEGTLSVSSRTALDGAKIILGAKGRLFVSPDASEEVKTSGISNVKTGGEFVSEAEDGKIVVETCLPSDEDKVNHFTVAVCTVPTTSTLTAASFRGVSPAKNHDVSFASVDNGNGTRTILMTVKRGGMMVIFR